MLLKFSFYNFKVKYDTDLGKNIKVLNKCTSNYGEFNMNSMNGRNFEQHQNVQL